MTDYAPRFIGPTMLLSGADTVVTCPVYRDGTLVVPTAATVTLYNAANQVVVNAATASITGNVATYTVTSAMLTGQAISAPWRIEWTLTISTVPYTYRNDAALVYRMLWPVISDADLLRTHKDFAERMPSSVSSYQDYLDEAWARIQTRLLAMNKRPWLVMSPSSLRELHEYTTLMLIFRDFATGGPQTAEWAMMEKYEGLAKEQWDTLTFLQADEEGNSLGPRRRAARSSIWTNGRM